MIHFIPIVAVVSFTFISKRYDGRQAVYYIECKIEARAKRGQRAIHPILPKAVRFTLLVDILIC